MDRSCHRGALHDHKPHPAIEPEFPPTLALESQVFEAEFGEEPSSLRQDFCGTARLCATWCQMDDGMEAIGIDTDQAELLPLALRGSRPLFT